MNTHQVPITFLYEKGVLLNYCVMVVTVMLFAFNIVFFIFVSNTCYNPSF